MQKLVIVLTDVTHLLVSWRLYKENLKLEPRRH
jgi:hypothetical protein